MIKIRLFRSLRAFTFPAVFASWLFLGLSTTSIAGAQSKPADAGIRETRLPNGLIVLTKEVHAAPVVCTYVWYRVGSRNEVPGITGISHQIEHMMFKGTKKLFPNPGYIDLLIGQYGGENNAQTDTDTTSYYLLLPSDQLDLALRIEADRMTNAAMDPNQLTAEKRVVLSELEGDENNNAYYLYENTRATAFQYHPYHYPVIGTKFDVLHFTRAQVYDYYRAHYAPNNATLVLVGDFDTNRVLARIRALCQNVPAQAIPNRPLDPEPPQRGERRVVVRRAGATSYLEVMYHIPAATHPDLPALTVLATALSDGRSSRLYRALVETQLATDVSAVANLGIDPEVFDISISARSGVATEAIEKALLAELNRVQTQMLDARELQKAKNQTRADFIYAQDSVQAQAGRIGFFQTVTNDWRNMSNFLSRVNAVTAADVQRVAQTYLAVDNRTVGVFLPNGEAPNTASDASGGRTTHYRPVQPRRIVSELSPPVLSSSLTPPRLRLSPLSLKGRGGKFLLAFSPLPPRSGKTGRGVGGEGYKAGSLPSLTSVASGVGSHSRRAEPLRPEAFAVGKAVAAGGVGQQAQERRLANGMTVIVRENHANPTVAVAGFVRTGSVADPPGKYGLAGVVADMLTHGTATRTSQQIAEEADFVGAHVDASAGRERIDISAGMLSENFTTILDLLADVLRNPTFPAEELEKVKGETLTALQEEENDTASVATRRFYAALYPADSPFAHAPEGRIEDVRSITRDDATGFYRRAYRPDRTTLIIVGDVTPDAAFAAAEKAFGDWKGEGEEMPAYTPAPVTPAAPPPPPLVVTLPDKSQDDIVMGQIGISRKSPDYEAASIMNLILGGDQFVGRVGKRVRDTEGLAYYAYTGFVPGLEAGPWEFRAGANPKNVSHAITSAKAEVARMVSQGVTPSELAWAKDNAVGTLRLSMATNGGIAAVLESAAFYILGLDYADRYPQLVRALTKPEVDATARKYLRPDAQTVVVAGPPVPDMGSGSTPSAKPGGASGAAQNSSGTAKP